MPGYLGDDFDAAQPEDSDSVKFGAEWIRDLKRRVKLFTSVLFNLETGALKDRVIRHASLKDRSPSPAGTWNRVVVDGKGLVVRGETVSEQQTAALYTAAFRPGGYFYETETGVEESSTPDDIFLVEAEDYTSAPFPGSPPYSLSGAQYSHFVFKPPAGVRRVKATIIGAGGGAWFNTGASSSANWFGGGGGEVVETVFSLDGSGDQALTIFVGVSGTAQQATVPTTANSDGCPTRVMLGSPSLFADAGCGKGATTSAGGQVVTGASSGVLGILRSAGSAGQVASAGQSGSTVWDAGRGQGFGLTAGDGAVILQWIK